MIIQKSKNEIELMREAGKIVAETHEILREAIEEGISTLELDKLAEANIIKYGAVPSFKGYGGFPASICASLNDVVVHGIPSEKVILCAGDIISIDIGACYKGYHGDSAKTYPVGQISAEDMTLIEETMKSFYKGIEMAIIGNRISDISHEIQAHVEKYNLSVVRDFVGHGIGRSLHEDPPIPNYGSPNRGPRLVEGMVLAIEPMINQGTYKVKVLEDNWTVKTIDGMKSAHYEHTIVITQNGPEFLTKL